MNNLYLFQDDTIGLYEHKIDLLRNGYNYDSIEYNDIQSIVIRKGLLKNWLILLGLGLVFIVAAGLIVSNVYTNSLPEDRLSNLLTFWRSSSGFGLIAVLFLFAFGLYTLIISLQKTIKIIIITNGKFRQFEIRKIHKENKIDSLFEFLKIRVDNVTKEGI